MARIAELAGVSKNTVSLSLRQDPQVAASTRARVERIAEAHGYRRNPVVARVMAELRRDRSAAYRCNFALLNAHADPDALTKHPTIPQYAMGCRRRAEQRGYRIDEFWLHDPELNERRLDRILRTRGVRGLIILGHFHDNHLPARFASLWSRYATVVCGVRTQAPALPFCAVDHHEVVWDALMNVGRLGYRQPSLVVAARIDRLVEGRFSGAFIAGIQRLGFQGGAPIFSAFEPPRDNQPQFRSWWRTHRPDVVLTLHPVVKKWLSAEGLSVPGDVGVVQLERHSACADWAGIEQHNDIAAEAAVDLLVSLMHSREFGHDAPPRATLVGGTWCDGGTVRLQASAAKLEPTAAPAPRRSPARARRLRQT
jgi:DNA-binding LacI/PurR family transcriptional regulator